VRIAAASTLAAALAIAWAGIDAAATPSRASCAANIVRYQPAKHPTLHDTPWILARPATRGVLGFVVSYPQSLRDRRVNRSDGLVLWTTGSRIVWSGPSLAGTLVAQRLDGKDSFRLPLVRSEDGLVSELRFPSAGCWQLRLGEATAVVRVVPRSTTLGCDATPLRTAGAFARPLSSGIRGGWGPWRTPKGGALLYTHGHGGGWNMKVLWRVLRHSDPGLTLTGIRLDGDGSFSQTFGMVFQGVFPSTVDVPAAGCWLFRLRTARLAGVLVVQAIDADG
jgi:hypothetical protein